MTRKDYVAIARVLKNSRPESVRGMDWVVDTLAEDFATMLAADNPRFDRERFYAACGVTP